MTEREQLEAVKVMPRSVSQVNEYRRCPNAFYLRRVLGVKERPAAWLAQGTAVHRAAEMWERSLRQMGVEDALDIYSASYEEEIEKLAEIAPFRDWYSSGPYRGEQDVDRRFTIGLQQTEKYVSYYWGPGKHETVWATPSGELALELEFNIILSDIRVRGFIDMVADTPKGVVVRDNKTGNQPGDTFQVATYSVALEHLYKERVIFGDYWMGKTGKPTKLYNIEDTDRSGVSSLFTEIDAKIKAEEFPPHDPVSACRYCVNTLD